ncbi:MAG TPA: DUF2520 domain-containing protein [Candidatus Acidoferrales bacterium]|nr:DUF2520 domain-containing protein [Candidatus Acidoferrales bacterium]
MKNTVAIVGAGRVGRELGRQLAARGWKVGVVATRSPATARAAVRAIGRGRARGRLTAEVFQSDLILITTPDDAIASAARRLAALARHSLAGKVVLHASGALASDALAPLRRRGAAAGSMHPLQAFAHGYRPQLARACIAIEGDPAARRLAARLAREMGAIPVEIKPGAKAAYHVAGSFASPQLLAVVAAGARMLERAAGFRRRDAVRALVTLARQTLENYERRGLPAAWTGPAARGDRATIRRHFQELRRWPREYRDAYAALLKLQLRVLG